MILTMPILFIAECKDVVLIKNIQIILNYVHFKIKWEAQAQRSFRKFNEHDFNVIFDSIL